jgi:hypothetical protein
MQVNHMIAPRIGMLLLLALAGCDAGGERPARLDARPQLLATLQAAAPATTFSGNLSQYTISAANLTVTDNLTGVTQAVAPNARLRFADTAVALDFDGVAGQMYRLYRAALNRQPDLPGLGFQINAVEGLGFTLLQVAQNFIDSPEFFGLYQIDGTMVDSASTTKFVTLLYANVLHRAPDPEGLAFHVGLLAGTRPDGLRITRAKDLTDFSESPENKKQVLDTIANGIEYLPFGSSAPSNPAGDFAASYSGTLRGADSGALTLVVSPAGALGATLHSTLFNADLTGSAQLPAGGKLNVVLAGGGHSITLAGSINLSSGVAAGSWSASGTGGGVFIASKPAPPAPTYATVQPIMLERCVPCHSVHPTQPGFNGASSGILFDTEAQVRSRIDLIQAAVIDAQTMPFGNITNMTQAERKVLAAWIAAGTP